MENVWGTSKDDKKLCHLVKNSDKNQNLEKCGNQMCFDKKPNEPQHNTITWPKPRESDPQKNGKEKRWQKLQDNAQPFIHNNNNVRPILSLFSVNLSKFSAIKLELRGNWTINRITLSFLLFLYVCK